MKREYFDIKEDFGVLQIIAKRIDAIRELLDTYPLLRDRPVKDVEDFLYERYRDVENRLGEKLNMK
jgi:hypothetical protein